MTLAVPVLGLTLLLNRELEFFSPGILHLGLVYAGYYALLWFIGLFAAAAARRILPWKFSIPNGWLPVLGICLCYLALAWLFNIRHNATTIPPLRISMIQAGFVLNLLLGLGLLIRWGWRRLHDPGRGGSSGRILMTAGAGLLCLHLLLPLICRSGNPVRLQRQPAVPSKAEETHGTRLFIIGVDGASWEEMDPLLQRGMLPNIAGLLAEGSRGRLKTLVPTESPLLWASMATGKLPHKHGVRFFLKARFTGSEAELRIFPRRLLLGRLESIGLMRFEPIDGRELRAAALWEITGCAGLNVGVVNWWQTFPAAPVNGYVVSDHVSFFGLRHLSHLDAGLTWPPELAGRIAAWEAEDPIPDPTEAPSRFFSEGGARDEILEQYIHERCYEPDEKTARIAEHLLDEEVCPDLFMIYWNGLDPVGHYFWQHAHPEQFGSVDRGAQARYGAALERYYEYTDELLGRILGSRGDNTVVMVVSDHGMVPHTGPARWYSRYVMGNSHMSGSHRGAPDGIILLAGVGVRPGVELDNASILDVAPTALALLGFPPALDMDGRVLSEALTGERWNAVASLSNPASYDGLKSRFPGPGRAPDDTAGPDDEEAYRRHLDALGYLE